MAMKAEPVRGASERKTVVPSGEESRGGGEGRREPGESDGAGSGREVGVGDELVMVLMPVATLDAAVELGRRVGVEGASAVMGYALARLKEELDARGVKA